MAKLITIMASNKTRRQQNTFLRLSIEGEVVFVEIASCLVAIASGNQSNCQIGEHSNSLTCAGRFSGHQIAIFYAHLHEASDQTPPERIPNPKYVKQEVTCDKPRRPEIVQATGERIH